MNPEVAARLDAVCDTFEQAWRSGADPDIGSFYASQVENDLRRMALPHLLAVDAEYRRARDGAAPSLDEYAALLSVDPSELKQLSEDVTWITGGVQTPIVADHHVAAGKKYDRVTVRLDARIGTSRPRTASESRRSTVTRSCRNLGEAAWGVSIRLGRFERDVLLR